MVLFSSGHRWPFFVSWNFSFVVTFSSRPRNGLVSSLHHFQDLTSSVLLFVDWATYKTVNKSTFPAFVARGLTQAKTKWRRALLPKLRIKVKNSTHLLPQADLGAGRGDRGHPFFFEILHYFYKILWNIKSIYIADKYPGHPFLDFLGPPLHPLLHPHDPLLTLSKRTWSKFIWVMFIINRLSVFWKDRALIFEYLLSDYL